MVLPSSGGLDAEGRPNDFLQSAVDEKGGAGFRIIGTSWMEGEALMLALLRGAGIVP